jgi:hypothetical protein
MSQKLDQYTGVSEHDARHLQQEYLATLAEFQKLVIEAIKALLKLTQNNKPSPDRPVENEISLMDNNEVVAGWVNQVYIDNTTEQFWKELGQVLATPVGEKAEGAGAKQITLNGKVILQSDAQGNVLVNEVLDNPELRKQLGLNVPGIIALMELYEQQRQQQAKDSKQASQNADDETYIEPDEEAGFVDYTSDSNTDYWDAELNDDSFMYEPDIYDIPIIEQEDFFKKSDFQLSTENFNQNQAQTKSSKYVDVASSVVQNSTIPTQSDPQARLDDFRNALNNGDFQQMRAVVADLSKSEKVAIFQQLNESEKVNAFELSLTNNLNNQAIPTSKLDSQIQSDNLPQTPVNTNNQLNNLVRENIFDKLNRVWETFQQSIEQNFGKQPINQEPNPLLISEQAQAIREEKAFIKSIYSMVENHRKENDDLGETISLITEKYTINNYNNHYEVENSAGEKILSFDNTLTGLKLESSNLNDEARKDFVELSNLQKMGKPSEAFLPVGAVETEAMLRSINIANSLTDIAQQSNSNIKVDGANFNYKWASKPNGEVNIWKKGTDGDELLLSRSSKGEMQFNMLEIAECINSNRESSNKILSIVQTNTSI